MYFTHQVNRSSICLPATEAPIFLQKKKKEERKKKRKKERKKERKKKKRREKVKTTVERFTEVVNK